LLTPHAPTTICWGVPGGTRLHLVGFFLRRIRSCREGPETLRGRGTVVLGREASRGGSPVAQGAVWVCMIRHLRPRLGVPCGGSYRILLDPPEHDRSTRWAGLAAAGRSGRGSCRPVGNAGRIRRRAFCPPPCSGSGFPGLGVSSPFLRILLGIGSRDALILPVHSSSGRLIGLAGGMRFGRCFGADRSRGHRAAGVGIRLPPSVCSVFGQLHRRIPHRGLPSARHLLRPRKVVRRPPDLALHCRARCIFVLLGSKNRRYGRLHWRGRAEGPFGQPGEEIRHQETIIR
jgi:hypothetical protein